MLALSLGAIGLYLLISKTRVGMLIRAGAVNPAMVAALGVNVAWTRVTVIIGAVGMIAMATAV